MWTYLGASDAAGIGQIASHTLRAMYEQYQKTVESGEHNKWQQDKHHQCKHTPDIIVQTILAQTRQRVYIVGSL